MSSKGEFELEGEFEFEGEGEFELEGDQPRQKNLRRRDDGALGTSRGGERIRTGSGRAFPSLDRYGGEQTPAHGSEGRRSGSSQSASRRRPGSRPYDSRS